MVDIIHRIGIKAPLAEVYDAVATIPGVAGWWTRDTSGSAEPGGRVKVVFRHGDGHEIGQMEFEMAELEPARAVRWRFVSGPPEWLGTEATFDLINDGEMTVLLFGHRGWQDAVEFTAHCSTKWAVFLLSLRDLIETGRGSPAPDDLKIDNWN
ncbi:MAG: SRPBCC domain-containing protein [Gemmatimonadales bacterium]|nr:SRPBCC domain-containing protein [Gemmatimonadales bacterium]